MQPAYKIEALSPNEVKSSELHLKLFFPDQTTFR